MNRSRIALALLLLLLPTSTLWALEPDERLQFADGLYARDLHDLAAPEYQSFLKDFP